VRRPFLHRSPTNSARLSVASQFVERRSASDSLERLSRRMSNYNAIVRVEEWEIEAMAEEAEIQAEGSARVHRGGAEERGQAARCFRRRPSRVA
jgi:hypothetical protein